MTLVCLGKYGFEPEVILDNDLAKQRTSVQGIDVVAPETLFERNCDPYVLIESVAAKSIASSLTQKGYVFRRDYLQNFIS